MQSLPVQINEGHVSFLIPISKTQFVKQTNNCMQKIQDENYAFSFNQNQKNRF